MIWIENFGQFFRIDALLFGTQEITVVKFSQIKRMRVRRLPQTQRLRHAITIADNREIPRLTGNGKLRLPASVLRHFSANPYLHIQCFVVAKHGSYCNASHPALQPVCHPRKDWRNKPY
ncbi:hypothetical protein ACLB1E_08615 [Escherichia coli]